MTCPKKVDGPSSTVAVVVIKRFAFAMKSLAMFKSIELYRTSSSGIIDRMRSNAIEFMSSMILRRIPTSKLTQCPERVRDQTLRTLKVAACRQRYFNSVTIDRKRE